MGYALKIVTLIMIAGVYMITCQANGRKYVGSTVREISHRLQTHKSKLNRGTHHVSLMQRDHNIHGLGNFIFEVLSTCPPKYARRLEKWYITAIQPEYNKTYIRDGEIKQKPKRRNVGKALPVEQLDLNTGKVIKEYPSAAAAARDLGLGGDSVSRVCRGDNYTTGGYRWRYKGEKEKGTPDNWQKKVSCIDPTTGEVLATYYSIKEAGLATNTQRSGISDCLAGRNKTAGGFFWVYEDFGIGGEQEQRIVGI